MRGIVVSLVAFLTASGLLVAFAARLGLAAWHTRLLSLAHYWGGLLFLVVFSLYAWDHIRANRHWLRVLAPVSGSGVVQTLSAVLLIVSGLVLMAYGVNTWQVARWLHHGLTYLLAAALVLHYFSPKQWRR